MTTNLKFSEYRRLDASPRIEMWEDDQLIGVIETDSNGIFRFRAYMGRWLTSDQLIMAGKKLQEIIGRENALRNM